MALATDTPRVYEAESSPDFGEQPVKASTTIYLGSAVTLATGLGRPLNTADTADGFAGFCVQKADNSAGADSAINVKIRRRGYVKLSVATASGVGNVADAVYASDDNTFTLASTGNLQIGKVAKWLSGTTCIVYFEGLPQRSI